MECEIYGEIPERYYKDGKAMIIKIQIPVEGEKDKALVYDQTKEWNLFIPINETLLEVMGEDIKCYFKAHFNQEQELVIDKEIGWQPW